MKPNGEFNRLWLPINMAKLGKWKFTLSGKTYNNLKVPISQNSGGV